MDMTELSDRLACSRQDKLACMGTVEVLRELARAGAAADLSVLDQLVPEEDSFFQTCREVLQENRRRELVKAVLTGYLLSEAVRGREFLRRLIIVHGLLLLLDGAEADELTFALQGWFGPGFREEYQARLRAETDSSRPRLRSLWPEFDELAQASMPFIVRLTFEVNASTLALALLGAGQEVRERIAEGITTREKEEAIRLLMEDLAQAGAGDIEDAQRWICEYSRKLMDQCPEF